MRKSPLAARQESQLLACLVRVAAEAAARRSGAPEPRRGGARGHRAAVLSLDSALRLPLRVVLVEGRDEGKPGGLHDIGGRRADRNDRSILRSAVSDPLWTVLFMKRRSAAAPTPRPAGPQDRPGTPAGK